MNVRFWGTRGSIPVSGPDTLRFGGNTPCVTVATGGGSFIILDCGSGIRELGRHLLGAGGRPVNASIFVTHFHWDHIQGFPFFAPAFIPGNCLRLYASKDLESRLEAVLQGQMEFEYFPVTLDRMEADIQFEELGEGRRRVADFEVEALRVNHPTACFGYRFEADGKVAVYLTDVEPEEGPPPNGGLFALDRPRDRRLVEFARHADLLILDGQYSMDEYRQSVGFGHSPVEFAVQVAALAGARRLALFHHDPGHSDEEVEALVEHARRLAADLGPELEVFGAEEGMEVEL